MANPATYEAIPEGEGWLIVNLGTGEHAQFNGRPLVNLPFDVAEDITEHLQAIERVLAAVPVVQADEAAGSQAAKP